MGDGTTGYDFLNIPGLLFTDNEEDMDRIYRGFVGAGMDLGGLVGGKKRTIINTMFGRDIEKISGILGVGFDELVVFNMLPVYRNYLSPRGCGKDLELISRCSEGWKALETL